MVGICRKAIVIMVIITPTITHIVIIILISVLPLSSEEDPTFVRLVAFGQECNGMVLRWWMFQRRSCDQRCEQCIARLLQTTCSQAGSASQPRVAKMSRVYLFVLKSGQKRTKMGISKWFRYLLGVSYFVNRFCNSDYTIPVQSKPNHATAYFTTVHPTSRENHLQSIFWTKLCWSNDATLIRKVHQNLIYICADILIQCCEEKCQNIQSRSKSQCTMAQILQETGNLEKTWLPFLAIHIFRTEIFEISFTFVWYLGTSWNPSQQQ